MTSFRRSSSLAVRFDLSTVMLSAATHQPLLFVHSGFAIIPPRQTLMRPRGSRQLMLEGDIRTAGFAEFCLILAHNKKYPHSSLRSASMTEPGPFELAAASPDANPALQNLAVAHRFAVWELTRPEIGRESVLLRVFAAYSLCHLLIHRHKQPSGAHSASYSRTPGRASLPAGCSERETIRSRARNLRWDGPSGRAAWGFRDFPHLPAAKENRNDSR
jgi:hypothetical protein